MIDMSKLIKPVSRWKNSKTSVYNMGYHLIWCPKYRRKVLVDEIEIRLKELILEKASLIDVEIIEFEVMPDHIHIFCKSNPTNSVHFIVQSLKDMDIHQEF
jgi:putative transposase